MRDLNTSLDELKKFLKSKIKPYKVVVMPDFFMDHFVRFEDDFEVMIKKISEVASRGGGNIPFTKQSVLRGGNSGNLSSALANLGLNVTLIVETSPIGKKLIEHFLGPSGVDLSLVTTSGQMSTTVALEFKYKGRLTNIMINDMGSLKEFGSDKLSKEVIKKLEEKSDIVTVLNWIQNQKGTELARRVFNIAKTHGSLTFLDTGDLSVRQKEIPELMKDLLNTGLVDIFGFNENEALWLASYYDKKFAQKRNEEDLLSLANEAIELLGNELRFKICMHTPYYAALMHDGEEYRILSFDIEPFRATGSGDTWNSGFIIGELAGLDIEEQILLGHAVSGTYLTNPAGTHPTPEDVLEFIATHHLRQ